MAKPTRKELEVELRLLRRQRRSDTVASISNNFIRWAGLCFLGFCCYLSIKTLAGQKTGANIGISFLANITISQAVAWIFGVGGASYGVAQGGLKKRTIKRLEGRIKYLERKIDLGRTSSGLTTTGDTHPEDK